MPFVPHTTSEIKSMLKDIGATTIEDLFSEIPTDILSRELNLPPSLPELNIVKLMQQRAKKDSYKQSFLGGGSYDHYIPAAIWELLQRGEYLTAYTPYQAEASQGTLQLLYEFQTMVARLFSMDVANASVYDGATAIVEAILMAKRCTRDKKKKSVLVPASLNPRYKETLQCLLQCCDIELKFIPYDKETGTVNTELSQADLADSFAIVIQQVNYFGVLEDPAAMLAIADDADLITIGVVNPHALGILQPPGLWGEKGVDIACGEGQPLGIPLASGGPYLGLMCCREKYMRQLPGRIVGRSVDAFGSQAFVLTLQAREQHIRRSRATSNICTSQGILALAAGLYLMLLGDVGLARAATKSHQNMHYLISKLQGLDFLPYFAGPCFHEVVLQIPHDVEAFSRFCHDKGVQPGVIMGADYSELAHCLLFCTTETKTEEDLDTFVSLVKEFA